MKLLKQIILKCFYFILNRKSDCENSLFEEIKIHEKLKSLM